MTTSNVATSHQMSHTGDAANEVYTNDRAKRAVSFHCPAEYAGRRSEMTRPSAVASRAPGRSLVHRLQSRVEVSPLHGYIDGGHRQTGSTPGLVAVLGSQNTRHGVPVCGE